MKFWILISSLFMTMHCFSKDIDVKHELTKQLSECLVSNSPEFLVGLRSPKKYHFEFKDVPTFVVGKDRYIGISDYNVYHSKTMSKEDYALDLNVQGLHAIQLSIVETYDVDPRPIDQMWDNQSYGYYIIFKNSVKEVAKKLKVDKSFLQATPQGNVLYICGLVG